MMGRIWKLFPYSAWVEYQGVKLAEGDSFEELAQGAFRDTEGGWVGSYSRADAHGRLERAALSGHLGCGYSDAEWRERLALGLDAGSVKAMEFEDILHSTWSGRAMREADTVLRGETVIGLPGSLGPRVNVRSYLLRGENG